MSSKLPKLDFIKHTDVTFLFFFIKIKFAPLTFSREFEIGFALYLQKHKENLLPTFTLRMGIKGSRWFRKASWEEWRCSHGWG